MLDPFAGGGAIPLEAMRLGCEVTAADVNPVAWFILKCTLDYPRRLAGQTRPLPDFALRDRDFMAAFLRAQGLTGRALQRELDDLCLGEDREAAEPRLLDPGPAREADLAWQVRAWGRRVLAAARRRLASRYPTYAEFRPLKPGGRPFTERRRKLLVPDAEGSTSVGPLNEAFDAVYLKDRRNPRWVATPAVAYLWARTVRCKGCRATIPLLKTRWLAKKGAKRVLLVMAPVADGTDVAFGVEAEAPQGEGSAAQRREHDKRIGAGTMSRSGAQCPLCQAIMTMQDLRLEGRAGRLGEVMTAVVVDGPNGKEYRLPTDLELQVARVEPADLEGLYAEIPFGLPEEPTPSEKNLGMRFHATASTLGARCSRTASSSRSARSSGKSAACPRRRPTGRQRGARQWLRFWRQRSAVWQTAVAGWRLGNTMPTRSAIRSLASPCQWCGTSQNRALSRIPAAASSRRSSGRPRCASTCSPPRTTRPPRPYCAAPPPSRRPPRRAARTST